MPERFHGVLVVDKPSGPTSHDVVRSVRRALGTRAVGHTGTLDPLATGVLVVALGEATKLVPYLVAATKAYEATIALGAETDTLDADGEVVDRASPPASLDRETVEAAIAPLVGHVRQRAPRVSAIKVGGRTLHSRVRRGEIVEEPVRDVWLGRADVLEVLGDRVRVAIECGKGFYVRSFARDLARALGTVGHVAELRRTRNGRFDAGSAVAWATVDAAARGDDAARARLVGAIVSPEDAWDGPRVTLTDEGVADARHGRRIARARVRDGWPGPEERAGLFDGEGRLVALAGAEGDETLAVVRGLVPRVDD